MAVCLFAVYGALSVLAGRVINKGGAADGGPGRGGGSVAFKRLTFTFFSAIDAPTHEQRSSAVPTSEVNDTPRT